MSGPKSVQGESHVYEEPIQIAQNTIIPPPSRDVGGDYYVDASTGAAQDADDDAPVPVTGPTWASNANDCARTAGNWLATQAARKGFKDGNSFLKAAGYKDAGGEALNYSAFLKQVRNFTNESAFSAFMQKAVDEANKPIGGSGGTESKAGEGRDPSVRGGRSIGMEASGSGPIVVKQTENGQYGLDAKAAANFGHTFPGQGRPGVSDLIAAEQSGESSDGSLSLGVEGYYKEVAYALDNKAGTIRYHKVALGVDLVNTDFSGDTTWITKFSLSGDYYLSEDLYLTGAASLSKFNAATTNPEAPQDAYAMSFMGGAGYFVGPVELRGDLTLTGDRKDSVQSVAPHAKFIYTATEALSLTAEDTITINSLPEDAAYRAFAAEWSNKFALSSAYSLGLGVLDSLAASYSYYLAKETGETGGAYESEVDRERSTHRLMVGPGFKFGPATVGTQAGYEWWKDGFGNVPGGQGSGEGKCAEATLSIGW